MAEDQQVLRMVWEARVPICFSLSPREISTMHQPDPYYLMLPRISYLPLVIDKVIKHFSNFVTEYKKQGTDLWIDFEGKPLKWHYPIGVLWDLFTNETTIPWNLTLHFENFPEDELIRFNNRALIESMFMSTIKEADALKHRSQVINAMLERDHNQLWMGLQNDKFDQFWSVNRKLMEHTNDELFRHIPFRVYEQNKSFIQRLIKPVLESGELATVKDLMNLIYPYSQDDTQSVTFVIHGIKLPLDAPLQWLSENMSYPDNFLHICAFAKSNS
ncbi:autophagy protein 5-like protein [Dinothrombium tinctorium]|uniref:Autophagy protein 5 n=1 Tax=Dinothrombium tinctorium TaxID=1965070 RepID=A0A3S4RDV8_9ACAR|nr:autophagy protein 5-like protein [Dinothrombium tinctorium]